MNRKSISFILAFLLSIVIGILSCCISLRMLNYFFPAVVYDSFGKLQHVMPTGNIFWSFLIAIVAAFIVLLKTIRMIQKSSTLDK